VFWGSAAPVGEYGEPGSQFGVWVFWGSAAPVGEYGEPGVGVCDPEASVRCDSSMSVTIAPKSETLLCEC
jgi:hypothetical protein